jgi:hypothetical protein
MLHKIGAWAFLLLSAVGAAPVTPQGFSLTGVNRFVTPNGDSKNDSAVFRYANTFDAAGTIRIYELRGRQVATVDIVPGTTFATWDPRGYANGVYVYVISIDQSAKSGVLVVVR